MSAASHRPGPLMRSLLAVAGVNDPEVLGGAVPRDVLHRHANVGLAMLVTALFACGSATASALMVLETHPWRWVLAPGFGLFWALAIFAIDRALVLSMHKAKFGAVLVRLVLALLVAACISEPLMMALFSDRLEAQLLTSREDAERASQVRQQQLHDLAGVQERETAARQEIERLEQAARTLPPAVLALQAQLQACTESLERTEADVQGGLHSIEDQRTRLQRRINELRGIRPRPQAQIDRLGQRRNALAAQRPPLEQQLSEAHQTCDALQSALAKARSDHEQKLQARQEGAEAALVEAQTAVRAAMQQVDRRQQQSEAVLARSFGSNFIAKAEAMHQLVSDNSAVRLVYLLILLAWTALELAPVLAKLMAGASCVDVSLAHKGQVLELESYARVQKLEAEVQTEQMLQATLDEVLPVLAREEETHLRQLVREQLAARLVLARHQELLRQLATLLTQNERQQAQMQQSGRSKAVVEEIAFILGELERTAALQVRRAFAETPLPQAAG